MLPITLDPARLHVLLVGRGDAASRRFKQLQELGVRQVTYCTGEPSTDLIRQAQVVMIVGLDEILMQSLAERVRRQGKLVHVEDRKSLCDFHMPSILRRGDLLIAVSTGGKSPALARYIRDWLAEQFPESWEEKLSQIAALRDGWRAQGLGMEEVAERTVNWLDTTANESVAEAV